MTAAFVLAAMLAACDSGQPAPPEPSPSVTPTSIIREGFEQEETADAAPLASLNARIGFPDGDAELSESALADLETLLKSPQMRAGGPVVLRAHSDSGGSDEANLRASRTRGEAVRDWLVERGIDPERIVVIVFGEQNPVEPNALPDGSPNEAGRAINRRVDIHVGIDAPAQAVPTETVAERFDDAAEAEDAATVRAQSQE